MQLIVDTEASIDIKRNMSTLNEEAHAEKLDVIQDLKSGICNGNKENIQSQENIISCGEDSDLENKVEEALKSPIPDESADTLVKSPKPNESVEIISKPSIPDGPPNDCGNLEKDNDVFKRTLGAKVEEQGIIKEDSENETPKSNKDIVQITDQVVEQNKAVEKDIAPLGQEHDSNDKNGESKETVQNIDVEVIKQLEEVAVPAENGEIVNEEVDGQIETLNEKGEKDENNSAKRPKENDDDENVSTIEKVENFDNNLQFDDKKRELDLEKVNGESAELKTNNQISTDEKDIDQNVKVVDQKNKEETVQNDLGSSAQHDVNVEMTDNNIEVLQSHDSQAAKEPKSDSSNTEVSNNHDTVEEIETVDLDDEEKEIVQSEKSLDIVSIDSETNVPSMDDSINDKTKLSVTEMETVDLDDEKDVSGSEAMDVDTNVETGKTNRKNSLILSSENDDVVTVDCDNNLDSVPTEELFANKNEDVDSKNIPTPMDEDLQPIDNENINKSLDSKIHDESLASDTINILDDEVKDQEEKSENEVNEIPETAGQISKVAELNNVPTVLKLSNTLDILSDEEEEVTAPTKTSPETEPKEVESTTESKCINIEDDDDIMLIDEEDGNSKDCNNDIAKSETKTAETEPKIDTASKENSFDVKFPEKISENDEKAPEIPKEDSLIPPEKTENDEKVLDVKPDPIKPLVPSNFFKTCKKNMAEMTREDLEEFCIVKIVESVVDRSTLSEIKSKLKTMTQSIEEYKKKAMMLQKQNRDLQVVLKTIQEEQKSSKTVTPLKITRSVGMQVLMTERSTVRRKPPGPASVSNNVTPTKTPSPRAPNQRALKVTSAPPQQIPVPRLVPASNSPASKNNLPQINATTSKATSPNGVKPAPKAEKRSINRNHSVTVDLTDDEPPNKIINRNSTPTPLRVVPPHLVPQNLLAATPRYPNSIAQSNNRKVYIPISGPQNQNLRPGQAIMLKSTPAQNPRPRGPQQNMTRIPQNTVRIPRVQNRHPAPLPECTKQYPGTYLKALPPAPDLKLSKVENGIVISWKIEGYQEDSYEEIASYQLYAYQETSSPPSTTLWKKIGDVKALPLPMACTLTQFMAGFKYYFAVRAVDIRSRIGPFSLPGSILLLNKL